MHTLCRGLAEKRRLAEKMGDVVKQGLAEQVGLAAWARGGG